MAERATTVQHESFVTTREAAELIGVSLRTAQLWVESGVLRAWKTAGGHRRIARNSVEELLAQQYAAIENEPQCDSLVVVVVDDDPQMLELYRLHIGSWDLPVKVIPAANGFEGLLLIGQWRPDLVIADLVMPGMNGFQLIKALKEKPELRDAQIVVATALGKDEIAEQGGLPKDVQVLHKPIYFERLEAILRDIVTVMRV